MTISIKKYLPPALLIAALFFAYRILFKYGFNALSNSFICQLTMLFAVLVYTAVRPPLKFLTSYLSLTLLYLGIPVLGLMCGHKTPAHEYLASFLAGNFLYFSALYLKLVLLSLSPCDYESAYKSCRIDLNHV